jgi:hypothetical protein
MADHVHHASRTLVKSAPELWAECSDAASLAKHLGAFGEIRITMLEPETAVVWEGEAARGTVRLEPSGWGTKVLLTADRADQADQVTDPVPDLPSSAPAIAAAPSRGLLSRLRWPWRGRGRTPAPPVTEPEPAPEPAPLDEAGQAARAALDAALDSLGAAHHRPYSRA